MAQHEALTGIASLKLLAEFVEIRECELAGICLLCYCEVHDPIRDEVTARTFSQAIASMPEVARLTEGCTSRSLYCISVPQWP